MRTIKFKLQPVETGEVPATVVHLYQAIDPAGSFALIDQTTISTLSVVDGYHIWPSAADPTQYLRIATLSDGNPEPRYFGQILGPVRQDIAGTTLEVDLVALGLDPQPGVIFRAEIAATPTIVDGIFIDPRNQEAVTDENGRASLLAPNNAKIKISSRALRVPIYIETGVQNYIKISSTI